MKDAIRSYKEPLYNVVLPAICNLHTDIQADYTHACMVNWKEHCETERWASNCLTFMMAVQLKRWTKTSLLWLEKVKPFAACRFSGSHSKSLVCVFQIFLVFTRLKVSPELYSFIACLSYLFSSAFFFFYEAALIVFLKTSSAECFIDCSPT